MENWFVVVMGIGTVFAVLILIIGLCYLLGMVCRSKKEETKSQSGCGSVIGFGAIIIVAVVGAAVILKKKEH